jgi:hypothetical protein
MEDKMTTILAGMILSFFSLILSIHFGLSANGMGFMGSVAAFFVGQCMMYLPMILDTGANRARKNVR